MRSNSRQPDEVFPQLEDNPVEETSTDCNEKSPDMALVPQESIVREEEMEQTSETKLSEVGLEKVLIY